MGCRSSSTFAVIVHGEPKSWFKGQRGVRQGDPLCPFLFFIVVNLLSHLVLRAVNNGLVRGLIVDVALQFVDDTISFLDQMWTSLLTFYLFWVSSKPFMVSKSTWLRVVEQVLMWIVKF